MKVRYYPYMETCYGNILWEGKWPMYGGKFPFNHPCYANSRPTVFQGDDIPEGSDHLSQLRQKGYFASCFPEGDGMSFKPPDGKTDEQIMDDFRKVFGWEIKRGDKSR